MEQLKPYSKKDREHILEKYGINILDEKKGKPTWILKKQTYKVHEDSDLERTHSFTDGFIGISKVDENKPFALAYFGDHSLNRYEFATASNDIDDIVSVLKNYDYQEANVEIYNPKTKKVNIFIIYPIDLEYTNESVGLTPKAKNGMKLKKKATFKSMGIKYDSPKNIKRILVKQENGKTIWISGDMLLSGSNHFAEGGNLNFKSFYIPKAKIVQIETKDGKTITDGFNGFHVKNETKSNSKEDDSNSTLRANMISLLKEVIKDGKEDKKKLTYVKIALGEDELPQALIQEAIDKVHESELVGLYLEAYSMISSKYKDNYRFYTTLAAYGDSFGDNKWSMNVWATIPDKYKALKMPIRIPIYTFSSQKKIQDQKDVLKIVDSFTGAELIRPWTQKIRIDGRSVVATDANILIHLRMSDKMPNESGFINFNELSKKTKDNDVKYPDWRSILNETLIGKDRMGKPLVRSEFFARPLIEYLDAVIKYGLTGNPSPSVMIKIGETYIFFQPQLLKQVVKAWVMLGYEYLTFVNSTSNRAVYILPTDQNIKASYTEMLNFTLIMPVMYKSAADQFSYYDLLENKPKASPIDIDRLVQASIATEYALGGIPDADVTGGYLFPITDMPVYEEGGQINTGDTYNLLYIPENKLVQQNISEKEVISIVNSMIADPSNLVQSFDDAKVYLEMNGYDLVKKKG